MVHFVAVAALAASTLAMAPEKSKWQADYGKALAATRNDQRPLLVVLDNPADPAASVDSSLLEAKGEHAELLKPYRLCRVDVSSEYGKKVAQVFGATEFPHTTIIDKTGKIVLYKKPGKIASNDWKNALRKFESGNRVIEPGVQTSFYRGGSVLPSSSFNNPSYCPSCQRKSMGL
jgi:hypothetical protein